MRDCEGIGFYVMYLGGGDLGKIFQKKLYSFVTLIAVIRLMVTLIFASLLQVGPAKATMIGDTVLLRHLFPNTSTENLNMGTHLVTTEDENVTFRTYYHHRCQVRPSRNCPSVSG